MNINDLTIGQAKELAAMFGAASKTEQFVMDWFEDYEKCNSDGYGSGYGYGYGHGSGSGDDSGHGHGDGYGDGSGYGYGDGYG